MYKTESDQALVSLITIIRWSARAGSAFHSEQPKTPANMSHAALNISVSWQVFTDTQQPTPADSGRPRMPEGSRSEAPFGLKGICERESLNSPDVILRQRRNPRGLAPGRNLRDEHLLSR